MKKQPEIFTITRKSRNLGIGWSNQPVQERNGGFSRLVIEDVTKPDVVGTLEDVAREMERARRINSGNDWRRAFFVGGVRVDREMFEHAMWMLRSENPERPAWRGQKVSKYMSDAETVYAAESPALRAFNESVARSLDEQYARVDGERP